MLEQPRDYSLRRAWLQFCHSHFAPQEDRHQFFARHGKQSLAQALRYLEAQTDGWRHQSWEGESLLQKIYHLATSLNLPLQEDPYLQHFLDQIGDFQSRVSNTTRDFLDWWLEKGQHQSVQLPEGMDAVQVMSIHKSKGLEFPVVICAFARNILGKEPYPSGWYRLQAEQYGGLPAALINRKKPEPEKLLPQYKAWYDHQQSKVFLDDLNRSYVAFTRAADELHIFTDWAKENSSSKEATNSISHLLREFAGCETPGCVEFGNPLQETRPEKRRPAIFTESSFRPHLWAENLKVVQKAPQDWNSAAGDEKNANRRGQLIHLLLAQLQHAHQAETVLQQAKGQGHFSELDLEQLRSLLHKLLEHPRLKRFFAAEAQVLTERSLLLPGQGRRIPDRLVLEGKTAHIIDYKTSAPHPAHAQQMQEYAHLLSQAGWTVGEVLLVYLSDDACRVEAA